ncbi:hypothetical protein PDE_06547 [Penicillium oxalicum 114-2]|uniref:Uncharacterized protein n=1 Tax=Penicillium oxalicum (strain 114-2 / CGMCC 5302) TaxID=933388 RepID=S8B9V5_PENO1|nr:hypothetical protein PDE_06547 [Penicillium oxalicum 114-2]
MRHEAVSPANSWKNLRNNECSGLPVRAEHVSRIRWQPAGSIPGDTDSA